jgi:methylenetetrahydrofolate reductase (NADPH)
MPFIDKIKSGAPTLSFELFPPKNINGWATLYSTMAEISKLAPDYISVTYGAGGSTRSKTVDLVSRIQDELGIESMAHLTCVGHSKDELKDILQTLVKAGIRNVLALRGDPPKGDTAFKPHPDGFAHASDLIGFIKGNFGLRIGCAFYPEKHMEAASLESDIDFLKLKQDQGAEVTISQLFFDNEIFYRFRDRCHAKGVTMPFVAGIMPVLNLNQLTRFRELSGCAIPESMVAFLGTGKPEEVTQRGVDFATRQCEDLLKNGIAGIHLYSLNQSHSSARITENLRRLGHFPLPSAQAAAKAGKA